MCIFFLSKQTRKEGKKTTENSHFSALHCQ
uniref:Uncharacterized protein n=1 Tax=Rhizophora mucronata TaxID=61149 RepID=A0A2P2N5I9_RHIMU